MRRELQELMESYAASEDRRELKNMSEEYKKDGATACKWLG
jgi:hypothetical protein